MLVVSEYTSMHNLGPVYKHSQAKYDRSGPISANEILANRLENNYN